MGEPFRAASGQPYPSAAWFAQADRNHDGRVSRAEFGADAVRFFGRLDLNRDDRLTPDEIDAYERDVAPETSIYARGAAMPAARGKSLQYGGPLGAGRYSWLNVPEPVVAADQDLDRLVTAGEFAAAAGEAFDSLDMMHRGYLVLADLPKTPQQQAIEGPCQTPKRPKHRDRDPDDPGTRE